MTSFFFVDKFWFSEMTNKKNKNKNPAKMTFIQLDQANINMKYGFRRLNENSIKKKG